ncbi:MAG TPA: N-acetyltransferase family protein [Cyclobacteriaceae bacterium]|nr:N-acetyltransferase family protein [Cyclobacteriaceae bacterium]
MKIVPLTESHYPAVAAIYQEGIDTGHATFETRASDWPTWDNGHLNHSRLCAVVENEIAGWVALTPVSERCVYGGVAEVSVYVGKKFRGMGIGKTLLDELITSSETNGIWTLQAGIFPENLASIKVHEQCGFRKVGYREKVGKMKDAWRDTVLLERRSKVVGV